MCGSGGHVQWENVSFACSTADSVRTRLNQIKTDVHQIQTGEHLKLAVLVSSKKFTLSITQSHSEHRSRHHKKEDVQVLRRVRNNSFIRLHDRIASLPTHHIRHDDLDLRKVWVWVYFMHNAHPRMTETIVCEINESKKKKKIMEEETVRTERKKMNL